MSLMPDGQSESAAVRPLFGITFNDVRTDQLADVIATVPAKKTRLVVTANVDHIVLLRRHGGLRAAYRHAWRRTIDGTPVWLYGKLRGVRVSERVTGADLFPEVMQQMVPGRHRLFFVVATNDIADRLALTLQDRGFSDEAVRFVVPPFGFEADFDYGTELASKIRTNRTTHLFFGVGCPRSECWIDEHRDELGDLYALAIGAAIGFYVGTQRRAPTFMRRVGMEWVWRLGSEPRRLGPRYLVRSWAFLEAIMSDLGEKNMKS